MSIPEMQKGTYSISYGKGNVTLLLNDVIEINVNEHAIVELGDVKKIQEIKHQLVGDKRYFILFITPQSGIMTKEAREYLASAEANKNAIAKAIITKNLGMRIFANFFITVNKPVVLHKAFDKKDQAMKWFSKIRGK